MLSENRMIRFMNSEKIGKNKLRKGIDFAENDKTGIYGIEEYPFEHQQR